MTAPAACSSAEELLAALSSFQHCVRLLRASPTALEAPLLALQSPPLLPASAVEASLEVKCGVEAAELHVLLPSAYPDSPASYVVTSGTRHRAWAAKTSASLQSLADACASRGESSLASAMEALVTELQAVNEPAASASLAVPEQAPPCALLLRLAHARDRAGYSKAVSGWARELHLGGRFVFAPKLVLLILEGEQHALIEFKKRLRTRPVDVDSHGRSCKERLASVERDVAPHGGAGFGGRFITVMANGVGAVRELLAPIGMEGWVEELVGAAAAGDSDSED